MHTTVLSDSVGALVRVTGPTFDAVFDEVIDLIMQDRLDGGNAQVRGHPVKRHDGTWQQTVFLTALERVPSGDGTCTGCRYYRQRLGCGRPQATPSCVTPRNVIFVRREVTC